MRFIRGEIKNRIQQLFTISCELCQHIPGVNIQDDQGAQSGTVLFRKLSSHQRNDVVNLAIVQLKIVIQGLEISD